jgi:hypothetical protein
VSGPATALHTVPGKPAADTWPALAAAQARDAAARLPLRVLAALTPLMGGPAFNPAEQSLQGS